MNPIRNIRSLLAILLIVFFFSVGVHAQDDTPVTPEPAGEVTEAAPVADEVVIEPTSEVTPLPLTDSEKVTFSWTVVSQLAMTIVVSFLAGGLTVGGGILLALRTILKSPLLSNMVEKLFLSQPMDRQTGQRHLVEGLKEVIEGVDKLTDGKLESETSAAG